MEFTPEHHELRRTVEAFVRAEINPFADQWEEEGIFPAHQVFKAAGDLGLLGITKPVEYGGMGLDLSYTVVMAEALAKAETSGVALGIGVQTDMCTPALAVYGSDRLKEQFLSPSISGDFVGCVGVSEAGGGSDVAALKTYARKDGGDYVISGHKMWITNGVQADWMCALVNTSEGQPHRNKSLIIIPMKTSGVHVEKKLDKMGMRSSDTAIIHFDEVRVPTWHLIGDREGEGFKQQMSQFQDERLWGAANTVAMMDEALKITAEYTSQRRAFGQALIGNQVIQHRLAELSVEVEALRALTYRACALHIKHGGMDMNVVKLASMAKLKAGKLSREVLDVCVQYHGGMGYVTESRINRLYRDVRVISIGGGADEVMLGVIAKLSGFTPSGSRS